VRDRSATNAAAEITSKAQEIAEKPSSLIPMEMMPVAMTRAK